MRTTVCRVLVVLVLLLVPGLVLAPGLLLVPAGPAPCARGQLHEAPAADHGVPSGARVGLHDCLDRLLADVSAPLTGWSVRHLDRVLADGATFAVPLRGGMRLEVARVGADASPQVDATDASTVRATVRTPLPFRVLLLTGPGAGSRVVLELGHRWCAPGAGC